MTSSLADEVAAELMPLVRLLQRRPGYRLAEVGLGGCEATLKRGEHDVCKAVFLKTFPQDRTWHLEDSLAFFVESTSLATSLRATPALSVAVVPGKVSKSARNEGFEPRAQRVLPLSLEEVLSLDLSESMLRRSPYRVAKETVRAALRISEDALLDLPLLSVSDPAVLYDLDLVVGAFAHLPPEGFRIIVPARD
jgi:hypothetical protein